MAEERRVQPSSTDLWTGRSFPPERSLGLRPRLYLEYPPCPFLDGQRYLDLGTFIHTGLESLSREVESVHQGEKTVEDVKTQVYFFMGLPGVGKTTSLRLVRELLSEREQMIAATHRMPIDIVSVGWVETERELMHQPQKVRAEAIAFLTDLYPSDTSSTTEEHDDFVERVNSLIQLIDRAEPERGEQATPGQPFPDTFEAATVTAMEIKIANIRKEQVNSKRIKVAVVDMLAGTGGPQISGEWIKTRTYGSFVLNRLARGVVPYHDIPRSALDIRGVGLVPHPYMELMLYYRQAINMAKTLREANEARTLFGFPLFLNRAEWRASQGGGSLKQVEYARKRAEEIIWFFVASGNLTLPSFIEDFILARGSRPVYWRGKSKDYRDAETLQRQVSDLAMVLHENPELEDIQNLLWKTALAVAGGHLLEMDFDILPDSPDAAPPDAATIVYVSPKLNIFDPNNPHGIRDSNFKQRMRKFIDRIKEKAAQNT